MTRCRGQTRQWAGRMHLRRRSLLLAAIPLVSVRSYAQEHGSNDEVTFTWSVPEQGADIVRSNLTYKGRETKRSEGKGLPLLVIFIGVALLPYLAKAVLALQRQISYGGVIVDTREKSISIKYDKALDAGVILIVSATGVQAIERQEITDPATLLAAIRGKAAASPK